MAKVEWSSGIDHVSGALAKPSKSGQHSCTKMLLGTHRVKPTESSDCNRLYLRKKVVRSTATDMAAFEAQKNTAGGKKTMKAYLWKICGDEYDQAHPLS